MKSGNFFYFLIRSLNTRYFPPTDFQAKTYSRHFKEEKEKGIKTMVVIKNKPLASLCLRSDMFPHKNDKIYGIDKNVCE